MYMSEMIEGRQNPDKLQRHDLFSNLLAANDDGGEVINLTESEIIGVFDSLLKWSELDPFVILKGIFTYSCLRDMRYGC